MPRFLPEAATRVLRCRRSILRAAARCLGMLQALETDEQKRDPRRCHPGNAACLTDCSRPYGLQFLQDLMRKALHLGEVEVSRNGSAFLEGRAIYLDPLSVDVALILG